MVFDQVWVPRDLVAEAKPGREGDAQAATAVDEQVLEATSSLLFFVIVFLLLL